MDHFFIDSACKEKVVVLLTSASKGLLHTNTNTYVTFSMIEVVPIQEPGLGPCNKLIDLLFYAKERHAKHRSPGLFLY